MAKQSTPQRGRAAPPPPKPAPRPAPAPQKAAPQQARQPAQQQRTPQAAPPSRPSAAPPQNKTTAVAVRQQNGAVAVDADEFDSAMSRHASGVGLSQSADDNLIPLVRILQKMSPQVEQQSADYLEGAQAGMIWLRGVELVGGEEGIVVQPCGFQKFVSEWVPRDSGGGLVNRWEMQSGEKIEDTLDRVGRAFEKYKKNAKAKRDSIRTPDGNELMESRETPCRIIMPDGRRLPFVVTMTGSNHAVARGWMVLMNGKLDREGKPLNAYTSLYRLTTKYSENEQGNWYKYDVQDLGKLNKCVEDELIEDWRKELEEGERLANAFLSGEKRADDADLAQEYAETTTGGGGAGAAEGEEIPF